MDSKYDLISDFESFITSLSEELDKLKKASSFKAIDKLEKLINKIRQMQEDKFIPRIKPTTQLDPHEISDALNKLFDPFFMGFPNSSELISYVKERSGDFLTFKKSYQLSHARGVWKSKIDGDKRLSKGIKSYFLSRLFIDYYETLPLLLESIIEHQAPSKNISYNAKEPTSKKYDHLSKIMDEAIFSFLKMNVDFRVLRNANSHAKFVYEDSALIELQLDRSTKEHSPVPFFSNIETMLNLHVIFATEFDIRLISLALKRDDSFFKEWIHFFEIYVKWFSKNYKDNK